jgi:hypothetical protein
MPFTDYTANTLMTTLPGTMYVALFSVEPGRTTPGVEFFTTAVDAQVPDCAYGYSRYPAAFGASASGQRRVEDVYFPHSGSSPATISGATYPWPRAVALGIFDASTNGHLLAWQPIRERMVGTNGNTLTFDSVLIGL